MDAKIVVGLGWGDEGKGRIIDYLCHDSSQPIVIRYNGGHQAGHTVFKNSNEYHVFSHLGSGSLLGVPTFWSNFCTFSPTFFLEEISILGFSPRLYVDPFCPVTTHYDVLYNLAIEFSRGEDKLGSCGKGFGSTVDRASISELCLSVKDLQNPIEIRKKLKLINEYYRYKFIDENLCPFDVFDHQGEDNHFESEVAKINDLLKKGIIRIIEEHDLFRRGNWHTLIFEGAQGILLDQEVGMKPYITKSNTTSKNAMSILERSLNKRINDMEIFYISRVYHTRHGKGPFNPGIPTPILKNNYSETNMDNSNQGEFRKSYLNLDMVNYALDSDKPFSSVVQKNLVLTCLDQMNHTPLKIYSKNKSSNISVYDLHNLLNVDFNKVYYSYSPFGNVKRIFLKNAFN